MHSLFRFFSQFVCHVLLSAYHKCIWNFRLNLQNMLKQQLNTHTHTQSKKNKNKTKKKQEHPNKTKQNNNNGNITISVTTNTTLHNLKCFFTLVLQGASPVQL